MNIFIKKRIAKQIYYVAAVSLMLFFAGCHSAKVTERHNYASEHVSKSSGHASNIGSSSSYEEMKHYLASLHFDNSHVNKIAREAVRWIGTKYSYGGHALTGTDCSGFIMEVFLAGAEIPLPRISRDQHKATTRIEMEELVPGDLVFFATGSQPDRVSHVGLYIGNNLMIHASSSKGVIITDLNQHYYKTHYHSAGRIDSLHKR